MKYYIHHKNEILDRLDVILNTIKNRFLPTFDRISEEANCIYQNKLEKSFPFFNPNTMDEMSFHENAMNEASYFYILQSEMKQEFLNHQATLLYHVFELDCKKMFPITYTKPKESLYKIGMDVSNTSNWYKLNTELRLINNVIKHGEGTSYNKLKLLRPDLFDENFKYLITSEITFSIIEIENYINFMIDFWKEFFKLTIK